MPFDEENENQSTHSPKISLKKVSTQKSIFESQPKKPSTEDFDKKIHLAHDRVVNYKTRAAELALQFNNAISDKTLKMNKTIFAVEVEKELLSRMIQLAIEINADPVEQEGMGSLSWITLLLKTCLAQRDRINYLEYILSQCEKKIESFNKETPKYLDKKKDHE